MNMKIGVSTFNNKNQNEPIRFIDIHLRPVRYKHIQNAPTPTWFNLFQPASTNSNMLTFSQTCFNLL